MHPSQLAKYGLQAHDLPHAKAWWQALKSWGWNEGQIDRAFQWYGQGGLQGVGEYGEAFDRFHAFAEQAGISADLADGAVASLDFIAEYGPEAVKNPEGNASRAGDAERRAEIEEIMRTDHRRYWRDERLQREHYEIIERAGGERQEVEPQPTGDDANRKAELQEMMKLDHRKYWNSPALQNEYAAILQREVHGEIEAGWGQLQTETASEAGAVQSSEPERN